MPRSSSNTSDIDSDSSSSSSVISSSSSWSSLVTSSALVTSASASKTIKVTPPPPTRSSHVSMDYGVSNTEIRLRGLRWRVLLGVIPPPPHATIESLRRASANGRRRYAEYRRRLIVDPHTMEDVRKDENLSMDNPLSEDPDSTWGRYFRNAELERIIQNDLARLYPEHENFFQSSTCQAMLRRILLVWALIHPQYGYRQGMHELLAPLVYVLHMDILHLAEVRQRYEDPFEDRFDPPVEENLSHNRGGQQSIPNKAALNDIMFTDDKDWVHRVYPEDIPLVESDEFGFNLKTMVLGSDSYGAEGELGALLSGRFMEHDAYCMLDSLLTGCNGSNLVLADYFSSFKEGNGGLSPVIEASGAIYNTLGAVDLPLYIHLVGLGVEPQFFSLRWLRVLFVREFDLEKLLLLWDAIFSADSICQKEMPVSKNVKDVSMSSPRGSFISNFAVSMMLYLRPMLLAASNATSCLQKLLNFPKNADVRILIENAKMLRVLLEEPERVASSSLGVKYSPRTRGNRQQSHGSYVPPSSVILNHLQYMGSPEKQVRPSTPESYWEERWMNSLILQEQTNGDVFESDNSVLENNDSSLSGANMGGYRKQTRRNLLGQIQEEVSPEGVGSSTLSVSIDSDKRGPTHQQSLQPNETNSAISEVSDAYNGHGDQRQGELGICNSEVGIQTSMDSEDQNVFSCAKPKELPQAYRTRGGTSNSGTDSGHIGIETVTRASLRNLGHSMGESIKVLECFLCTVNNKDVPETEENASSEAFICKEGQASALSALAELRRIGDILIHMQV